MLKKNASADFPSVMIGTFTVTDINTLNAVVSQAIDSGCAAFDTSPSYKNERILGDIISSKISSGIPRDSFFIADKIDVWQMHESRGNVEGFVDKALLDMKLNYFDQLLIHWPYEEYLLQTWSCFEKLLIKGKVKKIGLSNVNKRIIDKITNNYPTIKIDVVQIEISPLRVAIEDTVHFFKKGIVVEAYSPMARMINEVKYSDILNNIANKYSKSVPQIILRWHIERNVIPVFTTSKPDRIKTNLAIYDFCLTDREVQQINCLNEDWKIFPESFGCPGF